MKCIHTKYAHILKKYLVCVGMNSFESRVWVWVSLFLFYLVLCLQGMSKISSGLKDTCTAGRRVGALMKIRENGLVLRL